MSRLINDRLLTKEFLIENGIEEVSKDGKTIIQRGKHRHSVLRSQYRSETKKWSLSMTECIYIRGVYHYIQDIVYAWYYGEKPLGKYVNFEDGNIYNFNLDNLYLDDNIRLSEGKYRAFLNNLNKL